MTIRRTILVKKGSRSVNHHKLIAVFFGFSLLLTACKLQSFSANVSAESNFTTASSAMIAQSDKLTLEAFDNELSKQEYLSLEQFQRNYETALGLLNVGVLPESKMNVYDPDGRNAADGGTAISDGFYTVSLDPTIYGVSRFFVIPAGLRDMTSEEYLELAQAAGMPSNELIKEENSWISLQGERGSSNRPLNQKEQFWMKFQAYEYFRSMGESRTQPDVPITVYVGCGDAMRTFTIYPAEEMSAYALQVTAVKQYRYLAKDERALWFPTEEELAWKDAVSVAKISICEYAKQENTPVKDYVQYSCGGLIDGELRNGLWSVALYYEGGDSYLVDLDSATGEIITIRRMPDGFFDYSYVWEDEETVPEGEIVFSK